MPQVAETVANYRTDQQRCAIHNAKFIKSVNGECEKCTPRKFLGIYNLILQ